MCQGGGEWTHASNLTALGRTTLHCIDNPAKNRLRKPSLDILRLPTTRARAKGKGPVHAQSIVDGARAIRVEFPRGTELGPVGGDE